MSRLRGRMGPARLRDAASALAQPVRALPLAAYTVAGKIVKISAPYLMAH